jgi:hypothetical protein
MKPILTLLAALWFVPLAEAQESLQKWKHSGTLAILTTPDGANLPASARVEGFPLLVRLSQETFDFRQAQPGGEDVRFSIDGALLAHQVEMWDAEQGSAAIWVRVPVIMGNERQLITMHWGRDDAASGSSGEAVFNESNGYVVAMHLGDVKNQCRTKSGPFRPLIPVRCPLSGSSDGRVASTRGRGSPAARRFLDCPSARNPTRRRPGFRAEQVNTTVVGWGNEQATRARL